MKFADITIGKKLIGSFSLVVLIFCGITVYQIMAMNNLAKLQNEGADRANDAVEVGQILERLGQAYTVMADGIINQEMATTHNDFAEVKLQAKKDIARIHALVDTGEEKAWAVKMAEDYNSYLDIFEKKMLPVLENMDDAGQRFRDASEINSIASRVDQLYTIIADSIINQNIDQSKKDFKEAKAINHVTTQLYGVYAVIADAIINQNIEQTKNDFARIKKQAKKDIALVNELADTDNEKAWAEEFKRVQILSSPGRLEQAITTPQQRKLGNLSLQSAFV